MNQEHANVTNNIHTESIVKKVLNSEVKYAIGIILFFFGVISPYYDIKTDIALIKQNHLQHIETMQGTIKEMQEEVTEMKKVENELMKQIIKQNTELELILSDRNKQGS